MFSKAVVSLHLKLAQPMTVKGEGDALYFPVQIRKERLANICSHCNGRSSVFPQVWFQEI